jgi:uncharacterized protein DUF5818
MKRISGLSIAILFLFVAAISVGSTRIAPVKASVVPASVTKIHVQSPSRTSDGEEQDVKTFSGKVVSQNGVRFILRDESNDVWYHLDDQEQAGKFIGRNVLVTGVLDGKSAMIHVRSISEAKA